MINPTDIKIGLKIKYKDTHIGEIKRNAGIWGWEIRFVFLKTNTPSISNYTEDWLCRICDIYIEESPEQKIINKIKYLDTKFKKKQEKKLGISYA